MSRKRRSSKQASEDRFEQSLNIVQERRERYIRARRWHRNFKRRISRVIGVIGISGAGKDTLVAAVMKLRPKLRRPVGATTRDPRPGERDGIDYHFMTEGEFEARKASGEFLETAQFDRNSYGTLRSELAGDQVSVKIVEDDGAEVLKREADATIVAVMIDPAVQRERLSGRGDSQENIERRIQADAQRGPRIAELADVVIVNDDLEQATQDFLAVVDAAQEQL
jgi:guanylate kinase